MNKDIKCPYCLGEQDINHDDGYGYEEGVTHQQQCGHCDKYFTFTTSIMFHYDVEKADCLNGGQHDYKPSITVPREYTKMHCTMCDQQRDLTPQEMEKLLSYLTPQTH
jgi:hypothetical protein